MTQSPTPLLLPTPKTLQRLDGTYHVEGRKRIVLNGLPALELLAHGTRLRAELERRAGVQWSVSGSEAGAVDEIGAVLTVTTEDEVPNAEGYELEIRPTGIEIRASDAPGMFYGVCTLGQLLEQYGAELPALHVVDQPDFAHRGIMLDISRDKVPSMDTLRELVDTFASWKINQLQLYTEHTFSYRNHPLVWADASPITEQEVLELDALCRDRYIELVPNQNSFGHMYRWLKHEPYRDLAETHDTFIAWGMPRQGPFGLNPTDPRSIDLLRSMYDELLPNFASRQFNVGGDETIDLGQGKSKPAVERRGAGAVYLDFLKKIQREVKARGHVMQFWGDIIVNYPELVPQLPKGVIALEWGYEADHPFESHGELFAKSGVPFYVCPGTSSWMAILGRTPNMLGNVHNACDNGRRHGAIGVLTTDWGDRGHWQYLPFSHAGFALGAAKSWNADTPQEYDLARALDIFVFRDRAGLAGAAMLDLGRAYTAFSAHLHNGSHFNAALMRPLAEVADLEATAAEARAAAKAIDQAAKRFDRAELGCAGAGLIKREVAAAARLAKHGCSRIVLARETSPAKRAALKRELADDLREILRLHKPLWHARNRQGGYADSVAGLKKLLADYAA